MGGRLHPPHRLFHTSFEIVPTGQHDKLIISSAVQMQKIQALSFPSTSIMQASILGEFTHSPTMSKISGRQKMAASYEHSANRKRQINTCRIIGNKKDYLF